MKRLLLFLLTIHCSLLTTAQAPKTYTSSEILLQLKKLNVLGSVLYIAAHPDDENTRLLAYLANEKMYRTGYLSLTRGDGGQNLIGDEQGVDLGLIRTQELLAARRIDGAEQFFTRAYDFGYSKSPEEALRIWGHDKILSDVVWVIRKFRPDVIITRFPTTGEGGHGHHTASAILAGEAFDAAADSTKFPEQLKEGVSTWQAKRLLWNTFNFGNTNTQNESQFKTDVGAFNPLLGKSYGEIAALSRSQHKSQGFGVPAQRGSQLEYFKTIKGEAPVNDLFDGINTTWERTATDHVPGVIAGQIRNNIEFVINAYNPQHPEQSLYELTALIKQMPWVTDDYWKKQKLGDIIKLTEACAGLYLEASTATQYAVQGDSLKINFSINSRSSDSISFQRVRVFGKEFSESKKLDRNKNHNFSKTIFIKEDETLTQPYWLENEKEEGAFTVTKQQLIGMAENDKDIAEFEITINGLPVNFRRPLQYKYTDPVKGEIFQPVTIIPFAEIKAEKEILFVKANDTLKIPVKIISNKTLNGKFMISTGISAKPDDGLSESIYTPFTNLEKGKNNYFQIKSKNYNWSGVNKISISEATETENVRSYLRNIWTSGKVIDYDHIPSIYYQKPCISKIINVDLKTTGSTIGYIPGAGDKIPEALEQMGYKVVTLKETDINAANIKNLDAIVTGVRAYNTNEWMNNVYDVLMNYVKNGGTLLVQYNTSNQIGPVKAKISPYPFTISRSRITDETAKVNFLLPNHPALNYPNKITEKDFEGWVQERSIYHAEAVDSNYQKILSMADPGEKEHDGSLIVANYGKGKFVYTGLVFFRELPAGVPGAYRLFANLLASPKSPPMEGTLKSKQTKSSGVKPKSKS